MIEPPQSKVSSIPDGASRQQTRVSLTKMERNKMICGSGRERKKSNGMHVVGIDGCKAGWLGVTLDENGRWDIGVVADALAFWHRWKTASLIVIDIPVRLPGRSRKSRSCDLEARRLLRKLGAASSFPRPSRPAQAYNALASRPEGQELKPLY